MAQYEGRFGDRQAKYSEYYPQKRTAQFISSARKRSGSYSLFLRRGWGTQIFYGCDAGQRTVSIYCYPEGTGAKAMMRILNKNHEEMGRAATTSVNQWEKIEVSFTAEKGIYIVELYNISSSYEPGNPKWVYFDDLE